MAVLYDSKGNIIGNGTNRLDTLAAGSEAPVQIPVELAVASSSSPASEVIYPEITSYGNTP